MINACTQYEDNIIIHQHPKLHVHDSNQIRPDIRIQGSLYVDDYIL